METTLPKAPATWLRTDHPVIPVNSAAWDYLPEVEAALHHGVAAAADKHRPDFYEIEIGNNWYYIHVPSRLRAVYLVAVLSRAIAEESPLQARRAC